MKGKEGSALDNLEIELEQEITTPSASRVSILHVGRHDLQEDREGRW